MTDLFLKFFPPILAVAEQTQTLRSHIEWDWPETWAEGLLYGGSFFLLLVYSVFMYVRDTRMLSRVWTVWLSLLRVAAIALIIVIALNPHERTSETSYRQSRVALLIDNSMSMGLSAVGSSGAKPASANEQRHQAVAQLLATSPLIEELRGKHEISVYTFSGGEEPALQQVFRTYDPRVPGTQDSPDSPDAAASADQDDPLDWHAVLEPEPDRGQETRLGDSLKNLVEKVSGDTLSGIVVFTDGVSNSGRDAQSVAPIAVEKKARLVTVGIGSTEREPNLRIAGVNAPTQVQKQDSFEIRALVQGQSLSGRSVEVELLAQQAGTDLPPAVVDTQTATLSEDGVPVEFVFERTPDEVGDFKFTVQAKPVVPLHEQFTEDNQRSVNVRISDDPLRVLLVAGGPMRDYRFLRNMLFRHSAVEVDVWLQTIEKGDASSQDSDTLLFEFPTREELLGNDEQRGYDVIIAFDPDWEQFDTQSVNLVNEFVDKHSGGLILVAGDVYTKELARAAERSADLAPILELYPVVLNSPLGDFEDDQDADQPWKLQFTREGNETGFLQLAEDAQESAQVWNDFDGFYRCYPTDGKKAGAIVYAYFTDPRAQNEFGPPILFASQFYGSGRTLYLGAPEVWRLRSLDEEYFDRTWTKAVREMGQTRQKRSGSLGTLLSERQRYTLGQTVRLRANLLDQQSNPLIAENVELDLIDPQGRPLLPKRNLRHDENRPGQYVGDFRANLQGTYKISLAVPASNETIEKSIEVALPNLEFTEQRQNVQLLRRLADETGGSYLQLAAGVDLADPQTGIPSLLPHRGQEFTVLETIDERWDTTWMMYLIVALLSIEWLTRKLLKLS